MPLPPWDSHQPPPLKGAHNKNKNRAQSLSKIYIHLVFSTKNRTDTIPKKRITEVFAYIASILKEHKCPAICVGGTTNHIHILFVLDRNNALTEIVRTVKSCTTRWINESSPVTEHFCWQDGYGAFSVSQSHVQAVMNYIKGQEEHHKTISFKDEFRRLCSIYNVGLDERYVWI